MQTEANFSSAPSASVDAQSLSQLVAGLSSDLQTLVHKEAELATREVENKLDAAKLQVATLGLGVAALAGGGLVLLAAAVLGLSLVLPAWAAALVVGLVVMVIGAVLVATGKAKLSQINPRPEQAMANIKRDISAIKGAAT
jgi:hypothetical protein